MIRDDRYRQSENEGAASVTALDDEGDRSELRNRYYGLLQELRVVVTGVQVLLAFLLTIPFAQRFSELSDGARAWFGIALTSATVSVIAFVTPTAMHRFGRRTARSERLALSLVVTRAGLLFLGVAILSSFALVVDFVFDEPVTELLVGAVAVTMLGLWVVVPIATERVDRPR